MHLDLLVLDFVDALRFWVVKLCLFVYLFAVYVMGFVVFLYLFCFVNCCVLVGDVVFALIAGLLLFVFLVC